MDLVGLDVAHAVMKSMYPQYFEEPKYRPSFISEPRVAAGLLGRKTKRGWYEYAPDMVMPPEAAAPTRKPQTAWAVPQLKEIVDVPFADKTRAEVCFVAPLGQGLHRRRARERPRSGAHRGGRPALRLLEAPHADGQSSDKKKKRGTRRTRHSPPTACRSR